MLLTKEREEEKCSLPPSLPPSLPLSLSVSVSLSLSFKWRKWSSDTSISTQSHTSAYLWHGFTLLFCVPYIHQIPVLLAVYTQIPPIHFYQQKMCLYHTQNIINSLMIIHHHPDSDFTEIHNLEASKCILFYAFCGEIFTSNTFK